MTSIAITGVTGFVGRHLVSALQDRHQVRGLVRESSDLNGMPPTVRVVRGDVRDSGVVTSFLEGTDVVVHLAADAGAPAAADRATIAGAQCVVAAAREAGLRRLVYVSCLGADAASHSPFLADLWKAEMLVRGGGVPYTVLRPSLVVGKGDGVCRALASLINLLPAVPVPAPGNRRVQPIDVRDFVRCIEIALESESLENQVVSVGGPTFLTFRQLVDLVEGELRIIRPKLLLPSAVIARMAGLLPASARRLYDPARLALFLEGGVASPGIVQSSFGFEPRSILRCLPEYLA